MGRAFRGMQKLIYKVHRNSLFFRCMPIWWRKRELSLCRKIYIERDRDREKERQRKREREKERQREGCRDVIKETVTMIIE